MAKSEIVMRLGPDGWDGWVEYTCSFPGCPWQRMIRGGGISAEREGEMHVRLHVPDTQRSSFRGARMVMGNDAFAAHANLVNVARATFANEGIDLKTVETFECSVTRNHDFDEVQGGTVLPMWDTFAEVTYPAPADES